MKPIELCSSKRKGVCHARGCSNATKGGRILCSSCRCRKSRLEDPVRYAYNNIKHRADERGINFDLTIEQFREFCIETKYIAGKGRSASSYTIDRIIEGPYPGYTYDNIQKLRKDKNVRKYFLDYHWWNKTATVRPEYEHKQLADNPF